MVVTITGTNDHLRRDALAALMAAFEAEHGAMAIERLDGEESTADRMRESILSLPFLSPRKLVVLREPGKQKGFSDTLADLLSGMPETTDLIIYEPKLDKRATYFKTLKKSTDYKEFGELDATSVAAWAVAYAKGQGGSLGLSDARTIIDRLGPSQQLLKSELDKVLAYNTVVTKQSIDLLVDPLPQSTVFELLDAAFQGNADRTFTLYQEQRALKVEPQAIIAMLAWQLHILAIVKAGEKHGPDTIAKETKLNPFVVRKSLGLARRLSFSRTKELIRKLLILDIQLKSTSIDADEALRLYLLELVVT